MFDLNHVCKLNHIPATDTLTARIRPELRPGSGTPRGDTESEEPTSGADSSRLDSPMEVVGGQVKFREISRFHPSYDNRPGNGEIQFSELYLLSATSHIQNKKLNRKCCIFRHCYLTENFVLGLQKSENTIAERVHFSLNSK